MRRLRILHHPAFHQVVAALIDKVELSRRTDDGQDLVRVRHVRNLHADAVAALTGDGRLGEALTGQTAGEDAHRGFHLGVKIRVAVVLRLIDGVNTAAQVKAEADCIAPRLEVVDHRSLAEAAQTQIGANSDDNNDCDERNQCAGAQIFRLSMLVSHNVFPRF